MAFKFFGFIVASVPAYLVWVYLTIPADRAAGSHLLPEDLTALIAQSLTLAMVTAPVAMYVEAQRVKTSENFSMEVLLMTNLAGFLVFAGITLLGVRDIADPLVAEAGFNGCAVVSAFYIVYAGVTRLFVNYL